MIGIYKITSPSGKVYIGQSTCVESRISDYRRLTSCKKQRRLYSSLKAHGAVAHVFDVIEECHVSALLERERYWQDAYGATGENGLNCRLTATSDRAGFHSLKSRALMSLKQAGANNPNYGKRGNQTSGFGRKRTDEEIAARLACPATHGKIAQQIDLATGIVVREAMVREYVADGFTQGNISSCCTGRLKSHKGFSFQYKESP